jgi:hypothetical protein
MTSDRFPYSARRPANCRPASARLWKRIGFDVPVSCICPAYLELMRSQGSGRFATGPKLANGSRVNSLYLRVRWS